MTAPLFFCGELDSIIASSSAASEQTTSGGFDPTYSRCALVLGPNSTLKPLSFTSQQNIFVHFALWFNDGTGYPGDLVALYNSSSLLVAKLSLIANGSGLPIIRLYVWNGSAMVQAGTDCPLSNGANPDNIDIELNITTGAANLYVGGSRQSTASPSMASVVDFSEVVFGNSNAVSFPFLSQIIGHTLPTMSMRLLTIVENTNGPNQDWTGTVSDINELPLNDAAGITSTTANQVSDYYKTAASITGNIIGIGTSARFNVGLTGPQNIQNVLNVGGTVYDGPTFAGTTGFQIAQNMWLLNPATSGAWTSGAAEAAAFGVKSIT